MDRLRRRVLAIAGVCLLAMPVLMTRAQGLSLPELGQPANQAMSTAEERRLGRELMGEVRRRFSVMDDPVVNDYVRDIGNRIASYSGAGVGFEFFAIQDDRINAFAMPGGYIGVHSGLIVETESESEFASVMAHEIAHVTQRHIARQRLRAESVNLRTTAMVLAGLLIATQDPQAGQAAIMGGAAAGVQSQLNFSREFEREADRIGIRALANAGFRPEAMATFFERLQRANRYRGDPIPFLSTHPLTSERIANASDRADSLQRRNAFESPAYPFVRARLIAIGGDSANERLQRFQQAIESDGRTPANIYGLAMARIRAGRGADAIDPLNKLLETEGEYGVLYATLAEAHLAAEQPSQALDVLDEGLSLYPGDYALRYKRIEALLAAGKTEDALGAANDARRDFPQDVALLDLRAQTAEAGGSRAEQALATADYYAALGNLRGALRQLDRVLNTVRANTYQRSRAEALRERLQRRLEQQGQR